MVMQARHVTKIGPCQDTTTLYNPVTGAVVNVIVSQNPTTTLVDYLDHGISASGNYETPNPWSYVITYDSLPKGQSFIMYHPLYASVRSEGALTSSYNRYPGTYNMSEAYNNSLAKLNDMVRGGLDLTVAMAQSSATFRMIRALARWKRYFSGIGRKRWAKEWLELQYGWKPLLGDIHSAAKELCDTSDRKAWFVARTRAPLTVKPVGMQSGFKGLIWRYTPKEHGKAGIALGIKMGAPDKVQRVARWASLNPLSLAWELTPYSFVVDWFYDIGSYLRDWETSLLYGAAFECGYQTRLVCEHWSYEMVADNKLTGFYYAAGTAYASSRSVSFIRSVLSGYPTPHPPVIKTDLSWRRVVSAAALLSQQLK